MISKVKDLMDMNNKVNDLNNKFDAVIEKFDNFSNKIGEFEKQMNSLSEKIDNVKNENAKCNTGLNSSINILNEETLRYSRLLDEFSRFKSSLFDDIFIALKREIMPHLERVRTDAKQFDNLNQTLGGVTSSLMGVNDDIKRFQIIASKIKEMDFELNGYKKKLESEDQNKIRLLKQIDSLKSLIAKERRRR